MALPLYQASKCSYKHDKYKRGNLANKVRIIHGNRTEQTVNITQKNYNICTNYTGIG